MADPAPYFTDVAQGPAGAAPVDYPDNGMAHWLRTADGLRIRVAHWAHPGARGTILIFPGRTEFIEKYGLTAREFQQRGYASLAIDWRGQGLADRMTQNRAIGHVGDFADYQADVAATLAHAADLGLPRPYMLLGHSMGGCIGLRSLINGLDVRAVMFSAPMWGVCIAPALRPLARGLSRLSLSLGFDRTMVPGQREMGYALREDFAQNTLTNDPDMWDWFGNQLRLQPGLGLGGPSLRWLAMSLIEMKALRDLPSPDIPCLTYLGSAEAIVEPAPIHDRMAQWPGGQLRLIDGGQHEILMDVPDLRAKVLNETAAFFDSHAVADRAITA